MVVLVLIALVCVKLWVKGRDTVQTALVSMETGSEEGQAGVEGVRMAEGEAAAEPDFLPYCTEETKPSNYIEYTEINVDGTTLTNLSDYKPTDRIEFGKGSDYTSSGWNRYLQRE